MKILLEALGLTLWLHGVVGEDDICTNIKNHAVGTPSILSHMEPAPASVVQLSKQNHRVVEIEEGGQRTVEVHRSADNACVVDVFELIEPVDLELGIGSQNQKHAVDYAYSPVVFRHEKIHVHEVEEAGPEW